MCTTGIRQFFKLEITLELPLNRFANNGKGKKKSQFKDAGFT